MKSMYQHLPVWSFGVVYLRINAGSEFNFSLVDIFFLGKGIPSKPKKLSNVVPFLSRLLLRKKAEVFESKQLTAFLVAEAGLEPTAFGL